LWVRDSPLYKRRNWKRKFIKGGIEGGLFKGGTCGQGIVPLKKGEIVGKR